MGAPATSGLPSGCDTIHPLGITGTPTVDPSSGTVFAMAEVAGPGHVLVAV